MSGRDHFKAVQKRRDELRQAIVGLEDSLTTAVADGGRWRLRVAMAVDHAVLRVQDHVEQAEECGGFLDQVEQEAPHLARRVRQLRVDHERLELAATALRRSIADVDDARIERHIPAVRKAAIDVINQLSAHRTRGAELEAAYREFLGEPEPLEAATDEQLTV